MTELLFVLVSVALVWVVAVITPGPNFFITARMAVGRSRRAALFTVLGISTGTVIWGLAGFLGISLLFRTVPWVYTSLKLLGGGYLVFLGIKLIRSREDNDSRAQEVHAASVAPLQSFRSGLLTHLSNPKTAVFVTSLFAAALPADASLGTGLASVLLMCLISTIWYTLVAYLFSMERLRRQYRKIRVWIERAAGLIFVGFGVKFAAGD